MVEEKEVASSNSNSEIELDRIVQEYREEQEKLSQNQQNETSSREDRQYRGSYYDDPYLEDFNPMNSYIIIDLPWPESPQE